VPPPLLLDCSALNETPAVRPSIFDFDSFKSDAGPPAFKLKSCSACMGSASALWT
jgi:hypothetical protein